MQAKNVGKVSMWLLPIILVSYFVVGFPDGSFTISWFGIQEDLNLTIAHSGYILVGYSVTYTFAGVILSRLNRFMKLQTVYLWGLVVMGLGFITLALSPVIAPGFIMALVAISIYGFGTGLMAASMNAYMAKHFTARHNNWMHCFWGGGAAISPLIMSRMMSISSWSAGYYVITIILGAVGIMLLISMFKKVWIEEDFDPNKAAQAETEKTVVKKKYLTKKWHQVVEIASFFFLGGTDYTLVFFTGTVLLYRGFSNVVILSTIYYLSMTAGRMFFGWMAKWLKEVPIIRIGAAISAVGIVVLYLSRSAYQQIYDMGLSIYDLYGYNFTDQQLRAIFGMTLTGFGLGPLLPTLVSDTSNRFKPGIIAKLVGYELAAFGAGIAVLFFITSQVLEFITLEALFPIGLSFVLLVFICNEILAYAVKHCE